MTQVAVTDEFTAWYRALDEGDEAAVAFKVGVLERMGVRLGFPHSSGIKGSKHPLRELRIQSGGKPLRVFYVFDPRRNAVLLIGGDKTGDDRFYETFVPVAERIWEEYRAEQKAGLHEEEET
jgi:hypothetical protein